MQIENNTPPPENSDQTTEKPAEKMVSLPESQVEALLNNWEQSQRAVFALQADIYALVDALENIGFQIGAGKGGGISALVRTLTKPGAFKKLSSNVSETIGPIIERYGKGNRPETKAKGGDR